MDMALQKEQRQEVSSFTPFTGIALRALELLGNSVSATQTALALGCTESYISQLLANEEFAKQVTEKRYERLVETSGLDKRYEKLELAAVEKLEDSMQYIVKPFELLRIIQVINGTKRRGIDTSPTVAQQESISITLPTKVVQQITVNIENQVIQVGAQNLTTIAPNVLMEKVEKEIVSDQREKKEKVLNTKAPNANLPTAKNPSYA